MCIRDRTYRIYVCNGEDVLAECETATSIADKMEDFSRGFLYANQNKSYNVKFYIEDGGESLPFRIRVVNLTKTSQAFPTTPSFGKRIKSAFKDCIFGTRPNIRRIYRFFEFIYRGKRKNNVPVSYTHLDH